MVKTVLYPGTFDPITKGHLDIINRALSLADTLIVGVAADTNKNTMFCIDKRILMVKKSIEAIEEYKKLKFLLSRGCW